jgi:membrane associated rhomboid family serine protease
VAVPRSATVVIAIVTALVSLVILFAGGLEAAAMTMGFVPARLDGLLALSPAVPALLTPLSATLVHGGIVHLLFNLVALLFCGLEVERVLGAAAVAILYLVGAFAAAAAHYLAGGDPFMPMVGASGAISALVGAYALMFGQVRRLSGSRGLNRALHVIWLAVTWVAIQWMTGFVAHQQGVQLAVAAHIGGFLAGILLQRPLLLWRYRRA